VYGISGNHQNFKEEARMNRVSSTPGPNIIIVVLAHSTHLPNQ